MSDKPFFLANNSGFIEASAEDDLLHPEKNKGVEGDSLTETQYFGFSIPEHNIHALGYIWHHVNLGMLTGGLMVWEGEKRLSMGAELFDIRAFHNDDVLANDLHDVTLDNGYRVHVIEPLKRFRMSYDDSVRGNSVDIRYQAVTPAIMFGDGNHFEQGLHATGKLVLRGKTYDVDCLTVRDRSWGKLRPEEVMPVPPVSWMTGWFGKDFIFNCSLMDHVDCNPQATGEFAIPVEHALNGGWVSRNGEVTRIVKAHKKVVRDADSFLPRSIELTITEEDGCETNMSASLLASCPWAVWPNIHSNISLVRWTMDGRIGHGDCQDVLWNDYVNKWQ